MKQKIWRVIGLMSGTSLDGVDLVFVKIVKGNGYNFEIIESKTYPYSEKWKKILQGAFTFSAEKITELEVDYGAYLGEIINKFILQFGLSKIDFVASHGHTIFHQPHKKFTLQIGDGSVISAKTGLNVICDFRKQDLALGGQGAPLVPIGDHFLFGDFDFCLNLGGFSNVSFELDGERKAFDISPVNIVLNHYTAKINIPYDDRGNLSREGILNNELFLALNDLPFYKGNEPKSLGYEFVVNTVFPMIDQYQLSVRDVLRTFVEHTAFQIGRVLERFKNLRNENKVLITGGGAYNDFLIERIRSFTQVKTVIPDSKIIDFKEALIFALLGVLKDQQEINCLKSVTGALRDHSSGVVFEAQ